MVGIELVWSYNRILIQRVLSWYVLLIIIIIIIIDRAVIFTGTVKSAIHDTTFRIVAIFLALT
jgi:hypothetical protein